MSTRIDIGQAIVGAIVLLAIVVPLVSGHGVNQQVAASLQAPSMAHPFGTDQLGRDVFTRVFQAARLDLLIATAGVIVPFLVGTAIGGATGAMLGPRADALVGVVVESVNAFPFLVLAVAILAIVGPGVGGVLVAIWVTNWARYARIARARAVTLRQTGYFQSATVLGYPRWRILLRHVLPNVYDESLAYALSDFAIVILVVASLSYLGLGIRPPDPEWGAMMAEGQLYLREQWWLTMAPGAVLALTSVGLALVSRRRSGGHR